MKKFEILNKIKDMGILAVIRGESVEEAVQSAIACAKGGIKGIEVTYTIPNATEVIKELDKIKDEYNLLVGAGTVLDSETARIAILAGAKYIVSPTFDINSAKLCNRYQIPYMAGCMTIGEVVEAMEAGCDIIKLFPGSAFGPNYVKSIKAPLPQVNIMPTGGVNLDNVEEWFKNGVIAVGVGGNLSTGSEEEIIKKSKEFINKIREIKSSVI